LRIYSRACPSNGKTTSISIDKRLQKCVNGPSLTTDHSPAWWRHSA